MLAMVNFAKAIRAVVSRISTFQSFSGSGFDADGCCTISASTGGLSSPSPAAEPVGSTETPKRKGIGLITRGSFGFGLLAFLAGCLRPLVSLLVSDLDTSPDASPLARTVPTVVGLAFAILAMARSDFVGAAVNNLAIRARFCSAAAVDIFRDDEGGERGLLPEP